MAMNTKSDIDRSSESDAKLERLLDQTLHNLPLRRAPAGLEGRVLAELGRRASLPWWRHSFTRWPLSARAAFVTICAALAAATLRGGDSAVAALGLLDGSSPVSFDRAHQAVAVVSSAGELAALLARAVPASWLYAGVAAGVLLYGALFGLGAAAYRTLYARPLNAGDPS